MRGFAWLLLASTLGSIGLARADVIGLTLAALGGAMFAASVLRPRRHAGR